MRRLRFALFCLLFSLTGLFGVGVASLVPGLMERLALWVERG